jgi:hypothetical protein
MSENTSIYLFIGIYIAEIYVFKETSKSPNYKNYIIINVLRFLVLGCCQTLINVIIIIIIAKSPAAQSVQCLITDWTAGVRSPTEAEDVSSNLCVQTGSGAHPASCTMGTGGSFPGG